MLIVETKHYTFKYYGEMAITITENEVYVDARALSAPVTDGLILDTWRTQVHDHFSREHVVSIRSEDAAN